MRAHAHWWREAEGGARNVDRRLLAGVDADPAEAEDVGLGMGWSPRSFGVAWSNRFGGTADLARSAGEPVRDLQLVVGLRLWR